MVGVLNFLVETKTKVTSSCQRRKKSHKPKVTSVEKHSSETDHQRVGRSVEGMSDDDLKNEQSLKDQGVIDARRFLKNKQPTNTMTVTVRGTVAPGAIYFGFEKCVAKPYVAAPMQCYRCFEYGHTKTRCKLENDLCRNCSMVHQIEKDEQGKTICHRQAKCLSGEGLERSDGDRRR